MTTLQLLGDPELGIALPDEDPRAPVRAIVGPDVPLIPQGGGDLGDRLARVIDAEFARGAAVVAVVGSDHPDLPPEPVRRCLEAARAGRAGWILTEDGGFAALALPRPAPELFRDVPWSTPGAAEAVRANAARAGLALEDCGTWYDVDTPEDLDRLSRELAVSGRGCPATRAALEALDPPLSARGRPKPRPGGEP